MPFRKSSSFRHWEEPVSHRPDQVPANTGFRMQWGLPGSRQGVGFDPEPGEEPAAISLPLLYHLVLAIDLPCLTDVASASSVRPVELADARWVRDATVGAESGVSAGFSRRLDGGRGGIRTHGWSPIDGFQDRCIQPLCHPSCMNFQDRCTQSLSTTPEGRPLYRPSRVRQGADRLLSTPC